MEKPDTNYCYYYQGDNKLFLFYKLENDTIKLFVPNEIANINRHKMIDKSFNFLEIGCDKKELNQLRKDYNNGLIRQFYWSY